jgi:flagellum-specific peptidoglycan hydrolase FlgJ
MSKQSDFISAIAPLAQAEYTERGTILPSVCIAQAALESGWNTKAKTLFGIKGSGNKLVTKEFINGKYVTVTDSFKSYPNLAKSVDGYYEFLENNKRYKTALGLQDPLTQITSIARAGYATDPQYARKVYNIIVQYALQKYDNKLESSKQDPTLYYVNADKGLNVRSEANSKSEKICALTKGTEVEVLEYGTWSKIKVNGMTGYVYSKYITKK